jgi:hypothetical protein
MPTTIASARRPRDPVVPLVSPVALMATGTEGGFALTRVGLAGAPQMMNPSPASGKPGLVEPGPRRDGAEWGRTGW